MTHARPLTSERVFLESDPRASERDVTDVRIRAESRL